MSKMQIFTYNDTPIRTVEQDGELWWVLVDVCRVLELDSVTRTAERLEEDEVSKTQVIDSMGREQIAYAVNEPGLYSVILRSNKAEARGFKRWITHDVLPSIRQKGFYRADAQRVLTTDDYLRAASIVGACKNERLPYVFRLLNEAGIQLDMDLLNTKQSKPKDYSTMELLQDAQYNHGISMASIAERLGDISRPVLCLYRSGQRFPPADKAERIRKTVEKMKGAEQ